MINRTEAEESSIDVEITAYSKGVRVSTRKIRLVADAIRKLPVDQALGYLSMIDKRGAYSLAKTLNSAIANATNNAKLERSGLIIKSLEINEAQALKRFHPSTKGRVHPYKRRGTHIRVVLTDNKSLPSRQAGEARISKIETKEKEEKLT